MKHFFAEMMPKIQKLKFSGQHVFDFGAGAPDLPPPREVRAALAEFSLHEDVHSYCGYNGIPEYRTAVAQYYANQCSTELSPETDVLPVIGSKEAIVHFCAGFLQKGDSVLVPDPGYLTYQAAVQDVQANPIPYGLLAEHNFQIDINELAQLIKQHTPKMLILNTHHMPTGAVIKDDILEAVLDICAQHKVVVLNDNPYGKLGYVQNKSILEFSHQHTGKLELLSHSKMHNMAGWRIGAVVGDASLVHIIRQRKTLYDSGMSKVVQLAAVKALELKEIWYEELGNEYKERANAAITLLNHLNCEVVPYQGGMFVWAKAPTQDAEQFCKALLEEHNIFLVPGNVFGENASQYLRMSLTKDSFEILNCISQLQENTQLA